MMKYIAGVLVLFFGVFPGLAMEESFAGKGDILSVQEMSADNKNGDDVEILKINTSQYGAEFSGTIDLSVEIKDKEKRVYFGKIKFQAPAYKLRPNGSSPTGTVAWEFSIDSSGMKHPKFTGYSVEFFYEEDGKSVLLDSEYEDCDSAEELAGRNKNSQKIKIGKKIKVDYSNAD
jgi:hypothetical protein